LGDFVGGFSPEEALLHRRQGRVRPARLRCAEAVGAGESAAACARPACVACALLVLRTRDVLHDVLHDFDAGMRARGAQASLAPDLPADLMDVLANLNAYCQCMYGAAGKVAGCARAHD